MKNGSLCPHAQVPSACKLVGHQELDGRMANKWDVRNPHGFHVYFWTDEKLGITLRSKSVMRFIRSKIFGRVLSRAQFSTSGWLRKIRRTVETVAGQIPIVDLRV
jgi:hypothetical protein